MARATAPLVNFVRGWAAPALQLQQTGKAHPAAGARTRFRRIVRAAVDAADALAHFSRSTGARAVVSTTGGELRGFEADDSTWQFLGIPYAKPPLGELR